MHWFLPPNQTKYKGSCPLLLHLRLVVVDCGGNGSDADEEGNDDEADLLAMMAMMTVMMLRKMMMMIKATSLQRR